ncbi:MAG: hypothetical protein PHX08_09360 [Lachnospiraceae bacterium]|nr:hypothetical protein [Lachnospiraceae bacterium]
MKSKHLDSAVAIIFIAALVIIYFFWGCRLDLYVTILAALIIVLTGALRWKQNKKIDELMDNGSAENRNER